MLSFQHSNLKYIIEIISENDVQTLANIVYIVCSKFVNKYCIDDVHDSIHIDLLKETDQQLMEISLVETDLVKEGHVWEKTIKGIF